MSLVDEDEDVVMVEEQGMGEGGLYPHFLPADGDYLRGGKLVEVGSDRGE